MLLGALTEINRIKDRNVRNKAFSCVSLTPCQLQTEGSRTGALLLDMSRDTVFLARLQMRPAKTGQPAYPRRLIRVYAVGHLWWTIE